MRKPLVLLLSLVLTLGALAPAALAGKCSEDGCSGASLGGGGGGYTQRESGLWVPNRDGYIRRPSAPAPVVAPTARKFGEDLARDVAKDAVKGVGYAAIGAAFSNVKKQIFSRAHTLTLTGWPASR